MIAYFGAGRTEARIFRLTGTETSLLHRQSNYIGHLNLDAHYFTQEHKIGTNSWADDVGLSVSVPVNILRVLAYFQNP